MLDSFEALISKLESWAESLYLMLPNIALASLVFIFSLIIARYSRSLIYKFINKFSSNNAVNRLLSSIFSVGIVAIGLFIGLSVMNLDKTVTSLLAGAGIVGLAVGLAFQEPILNIFSGIMMSFRKPFRIGDMVSSNGYEGTIIKIDLRSTTIKKFTGEDVIIPNKMVLQNPIENYTLTTFRRIDIPCGVSYDADLNEVEKIATNAIKEKLNCDTSKEIDLIYTEFGDSSINFVLRFWLNTAQQSDYLQQKSKAIIALKESFDNHGIEIPFPIRTININYKKAMNGTNEISINSEYN